ncbi:stationary-phase-induced ribosome-associated protein [Klebsiella pneumoniae]|nr:stationary-phase-induced ribosome-associated protein [Klebsiella pneumoniae]
MKSNHQARHLLGLSNYKLSRQKKVVLEGDGRNHHINHIHATGRKRRGGHSSA